MTAFLIGNLIFGQTSEYTQAYENITIHKGSQQYRINKYNFVTHNYMGIKGDILLQFNDKLYLFKRVSIIRKNKFKDVGTSTYATYLSNDNKEVVIHRLTNNEDGIFFYFNQNFSIHLY